MHTTTRTWGTKAQIIAIEFRYVWANQTSSTFQLLTQDIQHPEWQETETDIKNAQIKAQSDLNLSWNNNIHPGIKARSILPIEVFPKAQNIKLWDAADRIHIWRRLRELIPDTQQDESQQLLILGISTSEAIQNPSNNRDINAMRWLLKTIETDWENGKLNQTKWRVEWPAIFNQQWLSELHIPSERMQLAIAEAKNKK